MKRALLAATTFIATAAAAEMITTDKTMRAADMIDADLYTAAVVEGYKWDAEIEFSNIAPEWDRIGEVEDIVLNADGQMIGVVAEVGGILDIGDKHVMIAMDEFNMFNTNDDGDLVFVTGLTAEQLKERKSLEEHFWH